MIRFLPFLFSLLFASTLHAACTGPSQFHALPAADQATLRDQAAEIAYPEGILWQVEKDGITSYILGTMHFPHPDHARTMARITPLMDRVDQVFVEITKTDELAMMRRLVNSPDLYLITEGPSLLDRLGEKAWNDLKPRLQASGMPPFMVARYQPWFLGLALSAPPCVLQDIKRGLKGIDKQVMEVATAADLPLSSLDKVDTLLALLASDPIDKQVEDFRKGLAFGFDGSNNIEAMQALYFDEEIALVWEFAVFDAHAKNRATDAMPAADLDAQLATFTDRLVTARNGAWLDTLAPALSQDPAFVAVGALHLPGPDGLLLGLERRGFAVTRLPLAPE